LASGLALGVVIWALKVKLKKVKDANISFFIYLFFWDLKLVFKTNTKEKSC
jgi:hypothetical protein